MEKRLARSWKYWRLEELLKAGAITPDFTQFGVKNEAEMRAVTQDRTSLWIVISTGFAGGFNPCALQR